MKQFCSPQPAPWARSRPAVLAVAAAGALALACSTSAATRDVGAGAGAARPGDSTITWLLLDIPPNSIPVNGEPSEGMYDLILKQVMAQMPGREHKFLYANVGRMIAMLQEGLPACHVSSSVNPERRAMAHLTINGIMPPLRLLVRQELAARVPKNARQEVLLEPLLMQTALTGALEQGRPYSRNIDAAVAKGAPKVLRTRTQSIQMLRNGHADYTIGFAAQLHYEQTHGERLPLDGRLVSLPIAGEPTYYSAFACPRTPWGRAVIDEVDAILRRQAASPEYLAAITRWQSPEERERMRPLVRDFIRLRASTAHFDDAPVTAAPGRKAGPE